jgi:fructose-1-phosphate kinase PfkB-like protein
MNAARVVTVTANPSLDRTITLNDALRVGEVQGAASTREDAGGKGINVARVIAAVSRPSRCCRSPTGIPSPRRCVPPA